MKLKADHIVTEIKKDIPLFDRFDWALIGVSNICNNTFCNFCNGKITMADDRVDVSDKTAISMPMRNLISILAAVGIGVYAFFGIQERLNNVETRNTLMEADLTKNTEFRIKWPRGELGALPADAQQDLLIEFLSSQIESYDVKNGIHDE